MLRDIKCALPVKLGTKKRGGGLEVKPEAVIHPLLGAVLFDQEKYFGKFQLANFPAGMCSRNLFFYWLFLNKDNV